MKRILLSAFVLISIVTLSVASFSSAAPNPPATPTPTPQNPDTAAVEQAILDAVRAQTEDTLAYLLYDEKVINILISPDGAWATVRLVMSDPQTGQPLHIEPGLALAQWDGKSWQAILPADPGWLVAVKSAPADVLSDEMRAVYLEMYESARAEMPAAPLAGYLLPWAAGQTKYLSQSVGHDKYTSSSSAHFAFDFYVHDTLWDIYAAKAGTVWKFKYDVPTCYEDTCSDKQDLGNYIVLQDTTTSPTSYQLYLHLAYDSIPPSLRVVGAPVMQGQFIGVADNTGQSWGDHLHFQVHTYPHSYWGSSVDIVFADVDINGGRPRVHPYDDPYCKPSDVCDNFRSNYVSANIPKGNPGLPFGGLTQPATGDTIETQTLALAGWGDDAESGLHFAQFMANYGGAWHNIGPQFTASPFSNNWDMCADNVPDGAVSVAVRLTDNDGNVTPLAGLTHVTKNFDCPVQPACVPGANEVVLSEDPGYRGCVTYEVYAYPTGAALWPLGNNDAAAIRVGANVMATLFSEAGFSGRGETFLSDDPNLSDNVIGEDTTSSMMVQLRTVLPLTPTVVASGTLPADTSVNLAWENGGGAVEYEVQLTGEATGTLTSTLLAHPVWRLGSLAPMSYTWQAHGHNPAGYGPWSDPATFIVPVETIPSGFVTAPYTFTMESGIGSWLYSGYWGYKTASASASTPAHSGTHSWWYQDGDGNYDDDLPNFGSLTSPPITIPITGTYYLRFYYRYETETKGLHWDQRWVQISVDGGAFTDTVQFFDDPMFSETDEWLLSPAIKLEDLAGHTFRVRFDFATLDTTNNAFKGWGIDDVSITAVAPPLCGDSNNTPASATPITYSLVLTTTAEICPNGDVDYYRFTGSAGDHIVVDIDAQSISSPLDPYLFLLAGDGVSALAEQDDEVPGVEIDPYLGYTLPEDGVYYLKVRAFDHPSAGGLDYDYTLRLFEDTDDPSIEITSPASGNFLPNGTVNVTALAADPLSGVSHVDFFWHDGSWLSTAWHSLGSDADGSNGWGVSFNTTSLNDQLGIAFYAQAYDVAGNSLGSGVWNLTLDRAAPFTAIQPISPTQTSTAFLVEWSGYDATSGIDHYDLRWNANGVGWQDYLMDIPAVSRQTWVVGAPGDSIDFMMRGVDNAGNAEAYPADAEASFITPTVCTNYDEYETDNTATSATLVTTNTSQIHSFCNPVTGANGLYDEDWLTFSVISGTRYIITVLPQADSAAATLTLVDSQGITLTEVTPAGFGYPSRLSWVADLDGVVYLRMRHLDGRVAGNGVVYRVEIIFGGYEVFLPVIRQ